MCPRNINKFKGVDAIQLSNYELNRIVDILGTIRAIGDLLSNIPGNYSLQDDTFSYLGSHMEDLTTTVMSMLGYKEQEAD
jgi:hypothetical protein